MDHLLSFLYFLCLRHHESSPETIWHSKHFTTLFSCMNKKKWRELMVRTGDMNDRPVSMKQRPMFVKVHNIFTQHDFRGHYNAVRTFMTGPDWEHKIHMLPAAGTGIVSWLDLLWTFHGYLGNRTQECWGFSFMQTTNELHFCHFKQIEKTSYSKVILETLSLFIGTVTPDFRFSFNWLFRKTIYYGCCLHQFVCVQTSAVNEQSLFIPTLLSLCLPAPFSHSQTPSLSPSLSPSLTGNSLTTATAPHQ